MSVNSSGTEVVVRVLEPGDESWVEAAVQHMGRTPAPNAADVFLRDPSVVAVGGFDGDQIIGFAYGYVLSRPDDAPMANLYVLEVWPDYQRMGVGSRLISSFRGEVGRVSKVWLVSPDSAVTAGFYGSLGARHDRADTVYELPTE